MAYLNTDSVKVIISTSNVCLKEQNVHFIKQKHNKENG